MERSQLCGEPYQETGSDSKKNTGHMVNLTLHIGDSVHLDFCYASDYFFSGLIKRGITDRRPAWVLKKPGKLNG